MSRHRRSVRMLSTLLALSLLAGFAARASEEPPRVNWGPETKQRLDTYRAASLQTLKGVLTPMVEKTTQGEQYLGSQWQSETTRMLRLLRVFSKATHPELKKWYEGELAAWTNVQTIGKELLDFHYQMASTLEEIEQDVKDSKAYYAKLKGFIDKTDDGAGRLNDYLDAASRVTDNLAKFSDIVGKITTVMPLLTDNAQTVARLIRQFHKRQVEFIKDRGRLDKHKEALAKLRSKKIDPDQSGVYLEYEKKWEETMFRTYSRYVDAVEEWQKENRWHDGREQLHRNLKTLLTELGAIPQKFLGQGLPPFLPKDAEELGEHCLAIRSAVTKAIERFKGQEWARIEEGLRTAEEERRELRAEFEQKIDQIEMDARMKAAQAEEDYDKAVKPLESELNRLAAQLSRETDDGAKRTLAGKMKDLKAKMETHERALWKAKRYYFGEWKDKQEDAAYKAFRDAIAAIDKRVAEFNQQKRHVD